MVKPGGVATSRRSLLSVGIALPFSVLGVDKALAFVEEEGITESERQRRELVHAIQERAAREKAQLEAAAGEVKEAAEGAGAQVVQSAEDAGTAVKTQIEEAAPKVESKIEEVAPKVESKVEEVAPKIEEVAPKVESKVEEVAPKVESKVEEVAPKVESKIQEVAPKVESKVEEVAPKVEKIAEAPKAAAAAPESVPAQVEKAAEAVTTKVEAAAESVRSKVEEVLASPSAAEAGGSASKVEAAAPELPKYGPGSAERIREANIRRPTSAEKYSGNPDDVNPSDPIYQRMDSSKMPDLPYLFPKENYGTPWVPPADAPADKIKPFFGPWDIGPAPEKEITRPFRELEFEETLFPLGMGLSAIATAVGFWVWNLGKPEVNWDLLQDPTGVVQQMKAEKAAFDAAEAERIARGEPEEESAVPEENKH
ncbi:hypothetical protein KFL_006140040 [Klebsormidium nitens]|uniref:Uncharacterized protein n=1 Tax=Klebsormidium nitens TaxID=105231 RepID=A0A1Y1IH98_KLENI|nr:hypothetical protein KFL_006140040 [Klebsormidium nitens]|eukprot:GAQ90214.1 hypothetical protein KFL_006140040 [Klebsormidium nitens]